MMRNPASLLNANFSAGAAGVGFTVGSVAKTNGSLEVVDTFDITDSGLATVGQIANKVGRTTGWSQGLVTRTCTHTGVSASNIVLLCQDFVESSVQIVAGGDSGSPVFRIAGGNRVTLLGSLWGGNASGTLFVYSPIASIESELGSLMTH